MFQKKSIFLNLIKIVFSLIFSISCFFYEKLVFTLPYTHNQIKVCDILLGILICIINYYFVVPKINKNKQMVKFLFFFESLVLILISLILLSSTFITKSFLKNFFQINNMILYIIIVHSVVELYIEYLKKNKQIIPLNFFCYLILFGLSFYLCGKKFNLTSFVLQCLGWFFLILTLFFIFSFWKKINIYSKYNQKNNKQNTN
ncbi:hypothetical protein [Candidatus Phytoplasma oryzae]|nr:hypothetical protein PIE28_00030 [Candidatus Phytoplasma oryzae]